MFVRLSPSPANDADHLIANLRATFKCIQEAGLKLTMHKCHFGAKEIDFLGRTITPQGVKPQKQNVQNFLEKTKFPKSKKALQRYLGFLNYYRNYVPRLSERLAPFYKMLKSDEKVLVSKELVQRIEEINKALDKCFDLALQQPNPNKQIALMTDASFGAAGYAVLIEDDPNQKFTSLRKSYAPVAYGSKTFTPAQIKMSIYAKEFLAIYFALKEFGHIFWGAPKPVIILTDNKAVTRFFQMKIIPPALWNACDYVIQFTFVIAHIPGAQNTAADYLSQLEADPKDKLVMKIREDVQTLPIEINVQSAGVSQEEQIFYTSDDEETEEQYWARKEAIRKNPAIDDPTVTIQTLSTNLVKQQSDIQVRLRKTNQIIIEQSKEAVLQQLRAKLLHEEYSENILQQDARYRHYTNNLERIVLKDEYSNVLEPILNPTEITIPPNDRVLIRTNSSLYPENAVTGILQPSDILHEEGDITFCPALVTLNDGSISIPVNNFTHHPYKLKKRLHIANFSVMRPEQMKYVKPVDPASTWHLLQNDQEQAAHYVSNLIKTNRNPQNSENYWFPTPENPGNPEEHTPNLKRILREVQALQDLEKLDPTKDEESRAKFLENFDWKNSTLTLEEKEKIEELLVEFHDIFARHRFEIGMNEEFKVKLTPKDDSPAYTQSLIAPINLKEDILVELSMLHKHGIITTLPFSKYANPIFAQKKPNGKLRLLVDLRKINNLITDDYINNNHPVSTLVDAAQHLAGKKLCCKLDCSQAYHCLPMADQRSIEMLAFNFASRTFAYRRLAQGLSRALSALSSFMRE